MGGTSFSISKVRYDSALHSKKGPLSGVLRHQDDIARLHQIGRRKAGVRAIQTRCCAGVLGQTPLSHQKTFRSDTLIGGQKPPDSRRGAYSSKNLILTDQYSGLTH